MKIKKSAICAFAFFLILTLILMVNDVEAQLQWPVEATNNDHPMGNSFGEFQEYGGAPYLHTGIDIREDCAPAGPWIRSITQGAINLQDNALDPTYRYNGVTIVTGTTTYRYWHLDHNTITNDVRNAVANGTAFPVDTRISQIVDWTAPLGNFHHLHFDISSGGNFINPFTEGINPEGDNISPKIDEEIFICRNNSNTFLPKPTTGCWVVDGDLDIIVRASDVDPPLPAINWQGNIGIYRIEYSINELTGTCSHNVPATQLYRFDTFPTAGNGSAEAAIIFKNTAPANSESDYWIQNGEEYYYIVTNVDSSGNLNEQNGYWDTDGGSFPDGLYQIKIKAYDFDGNNFTRGEIVFVKNNPSSPSPVEVFIRDRNGDNGTIPSNANGEAFWISPDIRVDAPPFGTVNTTGLPFGDEDHDNPIYNKQNRVYVKIHNIGCTSSGIVTVRLYWADPAGGIPPSDWNEIEPAVNKTVNNIPSGGSIEYSPPILWTPSGTAMLQRCLLVRLESIQDPIMNDYNVPRENNIAQKNIFVIPPKPTHPRFSLSIHSGIAIPTGSFANDFSRGWNILLDGEYHFTSQLSIVALGGYNHFKSKTTGIDDTYWYNFSINLRYYQPLRGRWSIYIGAGPGIYKPKIGDREFGANIGFGFDYGPFSSFVFELGADYHMIFGPDIQFVHVHAGVIHRF